MTNQISDDIRLAAPIEDAVGTQRVRRGVHVAAVEALDVGAVHVISRHAPDGLSDAERVEWIRTAKAQINGQASKTVQRARENCPEREFTMEGVTTLMPTSGKILVFTTITRTA